MSASSSSARARSAAPAPGQDQPGGVDGGQRVAALPAGGPDRGPVQQDQELEDGTASLRDRQHLLGELLGGIQVTLFQREAGQRAPVIHGKEMPVEAQSPGLDL